MHPYADKKPVKKKTDDPLPPIDIIYPTLDTVNASRLGPPVSTTHVIRTQS
jgi:hypothetical protein